MKMWMLAMPGLSERVLVQACKANKLQPQAKIISLTDEQWDILEVECAKILKLPPDWKDRSYDQSVKMLRAQDKIAGRSEWGSYQKKTVDSPLHARKKFIEEDDSTNLSLF